MKHLSLILLCSVAFAGSDLPGVSCDLGAPVEVTGSLVNQVSIMPIWLTGDMEEVVEPLLLFEPPSEYAAVDSLDCRFVVPNRDGICPAVVSLSAATIQETEDVSLTTQAQQAVDIAPQWLQRYLIWKLSILTDANQDRYGALLLAHQGENIYDELAFTVSRLSWIILANPSFDETLLVDNAEGIYDHDSFLSYVNVKDYGGVDYYSTTEYNTVVGSDTVWVEIPRDIYYNYVVMPKVSNEPPKNDASVYNEFWRQYLWDMDDAGYPVLNQVVNPNVTVFWDEQLRSWGWSTTPEFYDSLQAVEIVSKWTRATLDGAATNPRPQQPNVIAHGHRGFCGETQDLLSSAARTILIPTTCTMDVNEDHVWCELWWKGEWRGWYVDTINNPYCAYDVDQGGSKECSCIWSWRNDGYTWDDVDIYSQFCTFTVTVTDSAGTPVDNATVQIASEAWQSTSLIRGTWGQTDRNGQITFKLGNNQNYYINISTKLGGSGGGFSEVITNSIAGQAYTLNWSPQYLMPELDCTELSEGSWTKYLIEVNYELPADIMNGRDYYASPRSEYAEPLENGTADFFIVDSANWDLYQAGEAFDCYELIQGQSAGEIWFYAPHTDDWHIVFSGDRHQGVETFAEAEITLWEHDGTGIGGGIIPDQTVTVYPNPCVNRVSLSFATSAQGSTEIAVYDIHGRVVETVCNEILEAGSHGITIETSALSSGLYFVKFKGEGLNSMRSLTVLR